MEVKQMRYFLAVAKTGHMTRAAEELHIAQPALSQAIQRLESELGVQLFDRENRGIKLNANGKVLQSKLQLILRELDALPDIMLSSDYQMRNTIHINIIAAYTLIAEYIIAYQKIHPEVHFQLTRRFTLSDCDFTITNKHPVEQVNECDVLLTERFFLAVPPDSPFAQKSSIRLIEAANEEFIMCSSSSPIRIMCEHLCSTSGFFPRIAFESENPELARKLIGAGLSVGFWPEYSWGSVRSAKLLPIEDPDCRRDIIMIPSAVKLKNPAAYEFSQFLKNERIYEEYKNSH